jgi:hypothetical protein
MKNGAFVPSANSTIWFQSAVSISTNFPFRPLLVASPTADALFFPSSRFAARRAHNLAISTYIRQRAHPQRIGHCMRDYEAAYIYVDFLIELSNFPPDGPRPFPTRATTRATTRALPCISLYRCTAGQLPLLSRKF